MQDAVLSSDLRRGGPLRAALASALAGFAWATLPGDASAQEQGARDSGIEEIVVTARKREENLQDVPLVVEAFTGEELERRGITELRDVSLFTPGFSFDNYNSGLASPVIRGATQQSINALEQNVSTFVDGVYLPRGYIADLALKDLERIEVIKGPQSARYGRNAFMGAINYIPARPGDELDVLASVSAGSDDLLEGSFAIGGPVLGEKLRMRGSFSHSEFDGTVENTNAFAGDVPDPGTEDNLGGYERDQWSVLVGFDPTEALGFEAAWYGFDYDEEATPIYFFANGGGVSPIANGNCGSSQLGFRLYCGRLPPVESLNYDPRAYGRQLDADIYRASASLLLAERWSADYIFGRVEAETSQVGFSDSNATTCPWFGPGCVFQNVPIGEISYDSHELRIGYDDERFFSAMVGAYVNDGDDLNVFTVALALPAVTAPVAAPLLPLGTGFMNIGSTLTQTEDTSYFGEVIVRLLDGRLRLGGEVRRGREEKAQINTVTGQRFDSTFTTTTPRFTADFDLAPASLLYASAAKGTRSGGFNVTAGLDPAFRVYEPESNWTYELGSKNTFLDGRLQLNGALFYIEAEDTQISSSPPNAPPGQLAIILNLGSYTSQGFELSAIAQPLDALTLNLGLAYTDAEYDDARDVRFIVPCTVPAGVTPVCPASGDISGRRLPRYSPWSGTAGAQLQGALGFGENWRWFARTDVAYQAPQYVDQMNLTEVASRTIVNASIGAEGGAWTATLWARNLLDENYVTNAFFTPGASTTYAPIIGPLRQIGATLSYRF